MPGPTISNPASRSTKTKVLKAAANASTAIADTRIESPIDPGVWRHSIELEVVQVRVEGQLERQEWE
jgi:hypothetical protein